MSAIISQVGSHGEGKPPIDRFILMDDGSAIVESKSGAAYGLRSFDIGGRVTVPHCGCPFIPRPGGKTECRHRRNLRSRLLADGRLRRRWGACDIQEEGAMCVVIETECKKCGEFVVEAWVYAHRTPDGNQGFFKMSVCGCWGKEAGL